MKMLGFWYRFFCPRLMVIVWWQVILVFRIMSNTSAGLVKQSLTRDTRDKASGQYDPQGSNYNYDEDDSDFDYYNDYHYYDEEDNANINFNDDEKGRTDPSKSLPRIDPFREDFVCNSDVTADYVIGGREAQPHSQPWMVHIRVKNPHDSYKLSLCGGTLISDGWVLTAAHCFQDGGVMLTKGQMVLGAHDTTKAARDGVVEAFSKEHIFKHEAYNPYTFQNDLTLLRLPYTLPAKGLPHIRQACLPIPGSGRSDPMLLDACVASGWGLTSMTTHEMSRKLRTMNASISPCQPLRSSQICARKFPNVTKDQDTCSGDSGGPLICKSADGVPTIVGVLSSGSESCDGHPHQIPATYTRVSYYLEWMREIIESNPITADGPFCLNSN